MNTTTHTLVWVRATVFTVLVVGWIDAVAAAPQIISQPRTLAVDLGEAATFSVDAGGGRGFTYQWQVNGTDIFGATAATFAIDKVKLSDLGLYTVIVADRTSAVTSRPAALKLARWTEVVYFGASEGMAQYSNGPSWVDVLAETLGIRPTRYHNCAVGGADNANVARQIIAYLSVNQPTERTLLAFWSGGPGVEFMNKHSVNTTLTGHVANIQRLIDAGGRIFLIPRLQPWDAVPLFRASYPHVTSALALEFDQALDQKVEELKQTHAITVFRPDMFQFLSRVFASPQAYGFTNVNDPAQDSPGNDDEFFCWDDVHPTRSAHLIVSQEIYRQLMVEAEHAALLQTERAWAAAVAAGDWERVLLFWQDDATIYPGNRPPVRGKSEILVFLTANRTMPGFGLIFEPSEARVSPAADLGYTVGNFETSFDNPEGTSFVAPGRYVNVWRKAADGSWKNILEIHSPLSAPVPGEATLSDPPATELPAPTWPDPSMNVDLETQRAALLQRDHDLSEAIPAGIAAGEFDPILAFFHEDAVLYPAGNPPVEGKPAIRAFFEANRMKPGFSVTTAPFEAQVSQSGDLGYTLGVYEFGFDAPDGSPVIQPGVYLSVWEKNVNGDWTTVLTMHSPTSASGVPNQSGENRE